jgi:hypothetical protein
MVAVVLYAFATDVRSSRAIERHCRQDVAYRVITGNLVPDHATIARFVCRHERALADVFGEVLRLCDRAGLVKPGVVSIDATRLDGNCSPDANCRFEQIAREILAEAKAIDEPRTSCMARSVVMSGPSSCGRRRVAVSSSVGPGNSRAAGTSTTSWARIPRRRS